VEGEDAIGEQPVNELAGDPDHLRGLSWGDFRLGA
jgi:hypothetical protein